MTDHEMIRKLLEMSGGIKKSGSSELADFLTSCADRITEAHLLERAVSARLGSECPADFGKLLEAVRRLKI